MSRVEHIGDATLYLGEAIETLRVFADPVDCIITDPPYCSGAATEAGKGSATHQGLRSETIRSGRFSWFEADNMTTSGLCALLRGVGVQAVRLLPSGGSMLVFCDWRMAFMLGPEIESAGLRLRNLVVWDKGHFGCGTGFRPRHELALHLSKRSPEFHAADVGNVIRCERVGEQAREHETEKPVGLLSEMVRVVCPPDGIVCDPFMGSGTTGVACASLGRHFIGIEREPRHFETACRRIDDAQRQGRLFDQPRPQPMQEAMAL